MELAQKEPVFVNPGLEDHINDEHRDKLAQAWYAVRGFFYSEAFDPRQTLLSRQDDKGKFFAKVVEAATATKKLVEVLENTKPEVIYKELTLEEYRRQFNYFRGGIGFMGGDPYFSGMDTKIPARANKKEIETGMKDALWLITKCHISIDIANKRAPSGSYMALMKKLHVTFDRDSITPPTYEEGRRFARMLRIARFAQSASDNPAKPLPAASKKRKAEDE